MAKVSGQAPSRGAQYESWSWEPQPTPAALAKSPPRYPSEMLDDGYLEVGVGRSVPPFGTQKRLDWLRHAFDDPQAPSVSAALPGGRGHRRRRHEPVRGGRRDRGLAAVERRLHLRRASTARARDAAARRVRDPHEERLLPALRRRDGPDAPLPRDSRAGRRRLHERRLRRGPRDVARQRPERAHLGRGLVRRVRLAPVRPDPGAREPRRDVHDLVDLGQCLRGRERAQEERGRAAGGQSAPLPARQSAASGSEAPPGPRAATSPRHAGEDRPREASRSRGSSSPAWPRSCSCSWPRSSCSGGAAS